MLATNKILNAEKEREMITKCAQMSGKRSVHPRLSNPVWVEFVGRRYGNRYAIIIINNNSNRRSSRGVNDNEIVYVYNEC